MSESKLETAEEAAEKWHFKMLEWYFVRFEAAENADDRTAYEYLIANKGNLCSAFAAGFVAAMDRQA